MRLVTLTALTMLAGLALACGAVLGIDTDRVLDAGAEASGTSSSGDTDAGPAGTSGGTSGTTSSGGTSGDGGSPPPPPSKCDSNACGGGGFAGGIAGQCSAGGQCTRTCGVGTNRCGAFGTVFCPDGEDCVITCEGDGCDGLTCTGGHSCTLDCTGPGPGCHDAVCSSPSCAFRCKDNSCDGAACAKGVSSCTQTCAGPGPNDCKKVKTNQ